MGYEVIARRWRPRSFSELVGQEHIVRTLANALSSGRIAHAYLFIGPRGTGKTSTARIFAAALNASGGPNADFDADNANAKAIMAGNFLDVIEIDGASNNSVDQIRDLRESCQYAPAQGTFKIYIIDEVHMLSTAAFNALLKTLEEPPAHVKFIFATTEAQKVLPTIVSRCQRFEFRPLTDAQLIERLEKIATEEQVDVSREALEAVARLAQGGMRDAQSILDQLISFCDKTIGLDDVLSVYGLASPAQLEAVTRGMAQADYGAVLTAVDELAEQGRDLARVLQEVVARVRLALLDAAKQGGQSALLGQSLPTESLLRMLEALQRHEHAVQRGLSDRVNFEVALLSAVEASRVRAIDSVLKELTGIAATLPATEKKTS